MTSNHHPCDLCGRSSAEPLRLGALPQRGCLVCSRLLGQLLQEAPGRLLEVWPLLAEQDDGSPEPRVRLPDGQSVELRARTAELKEELPVDKRMQLAELYGELGLPREQLLEAAWVLSVDPGPELAQRALDVLFRPDRACPGAPELLRRHLLPS